jgi:hypothetical protein
MYGPNIEGTALETQEVTTYNPQSSHSISLYLCCGESIRGDENAPNRNKYIISEGVLLKDLLTQLPLVLLRWVGHFIPYFQIFLSLACRHALHGTVKERL